MNDIVSVYGTKVTINEVTNGLSVNTRMIPYLIPFFFFSFIKRIKSALQCLVSCTRHFFVGRIAGQACLCEHDDAKKSIHDAS